MKCQFESLYRSWKFISIKKKTNFWYILLLFVLYKLYFSDSSFNISSDTFCLFLSSDYKVILYDLEDWNFFFSFSFPIMIFFSLNKCSMKKSNFLVLTPNSLLKVLESIYDLPLLSVHQKQHMMRKYLPLQAQSTRSASITAFQLST